MMKQRHAVRAGSVRALGLLLIVMNGCGAQQCQGSAVPGDPARSAAVAGSALPAAPAAIPAVASPPAPTVALAPSSDEGSAAAAEEGSGSADEGSGIPPGMPEEGSLAYERLVDRLCARLASEVWEMGKIPTDVCSVRGGEHGGPRTLERMGDFNGECLGYSVDIWEEQPDKSWVQTEVVTRGEVVHERPSIRPEFMKTARYPTDAEIIAATAQLKKQQIDIPTATAYVQEEDWHEFIDLNRDSQVEMVAWTWHSFQCGFFELNVYTRKADGRWAQDPDARNTYFEQADYE